MALLNLLIVVCGFRISQGVFLQRSHAAAANASKEAKAANATTFGYKQTLHNFQNVQYYADFSIGGQKIAGIFDTGSFELLVRSTRCESCAHPTPAYDHTLSTSYVSNGTITKHVFGSGPCISVMGYDTVSVGDSLMAKQQSFWEIVDHRIAVLDTAKFAAIVGIGPNLAYGVGAHEDTLLMNYGVDEFSVCLQKPSGAPGFLVWGKSEKGLKEDEYATARVIGEHHWVSNLSNVSFSTKNGSKAPEGVTLPCGPGSGGCAAIVDSGTSLIAAPGMALMMLSEMIPPIHEDCSNLDELPNLHFNIDGNDMVLPPQAYVMRITGATLEANDIWDILFFKPKVRKIDMCMPAFMQIDMTSKDGPIWILGMPFFRYYHTTFDRVNKVMRFAVAGPTCDPKPYNANHTLSLLAMDAANDKELDMDVSAMVPPTLSEMIDFPFATGEYKL
jgi:hypothetical protein